MGKKILIIDDEPDLLKALTVRLESEGYEVDTAQDGFEGLNRARTTGPDLIILDLMLPKMNGFKVARLLKFDEKYKKIPIIMLSARTEEDDKELGKETGGDIYMEKPFNEKELLEAVGKLA